MTLVALVEAYVDGDLTRDELFAALTQLLSADPAALRAARAALNVDPAVRAGFEAWLEGFRARPQILLGGRHVPVTAALVSALAASEGWSTLESIEREDGAVGSAPTLDSRSRTQFTDVRVDA
jgi:hypothetical protein